MKKEQFRPRFPRLSGWLVITLTLACFLALIHPTQMPVILYKAVMVTMAAVLGYWIDRALFPYARPHERLSKETGDTPDQGFVAAFFMLRRAAIVFAVILGLTLGL